MENKNKFLSELKAELQELELISDSDSKNLIKLQNECKQLALENTEKETLLSTLNKEFETLTD